LKSHPQPSAKQHKEGLIYGLLGVLAFSTTLPATRLAVKSFDPMVVSLGRDVVAGVLSVALLWLTRQPWPTRPQFRRLLFVMAGVVFGFPILMSWAMSRVEATHGAVVLGLLPLGTAIAGFIISHERPSFTFWCASVLGSATVITFSLVNGGGHFHAADVALLGAAAFAALGYAQGARLSKELAGWQVICWALALALPLTLPLAALAVWRYGLSGTATAWGAFFWISVISAFLGFFAWYRGLAAGGVARISQIQLLQPFFTLIVASLFIGEHFKLSALIAATIVALSIFISRRSKIVTLHHPSPAN
jgi:drug/metabolite transporter (DMT)-like permease